MGSALPPRFTCLSLIISTIEEYLPSSILAFFAEHPQFAENDLYITGESYAGHYISAFAVRIHQGNKAKEGIHINLKGFAIGNGLTDPAVQYKAYSDYALENGVIKNPDYWCFSSYQSIQVASSL